MCHVDQDQLMTQPIEGKQEQRQIWPYLQGLLPSPSHSISVNLIQSRGAVPPMITF